MVIVSCLEMEIVRLWWINQGIIQNEENLKGNVLLAAIPGKKWLKMVKELVFKDEMTRIY